MDYKHIDRFGRVWHRCDHITNMMRRTFGFIWVGRVRYCRPLERIVEPTFQFLPN